MRASRPGWKSATAIRFANSARFNLGTAQDVGVTRLGNDNWIMAYVHIAHDCQLGNDIILANNATLAGHVHLGDWVFLGGFTTVHQFCHIGAHAMTAFTAAVSQDVPPFVTAAGNRAVPAGINSEGLKRRGFQQRADHGDQARLQIDLPRRIAARAATVGVAGRRDRNPRKLRNTCA